MNNWTDSLQEVRKSDGDKIPKDFKTRAELQELWGVSQAEATRRVGKLLGAGLSERKDFKKLTPAGIRPVPHYRIR